MSDHPPNSINIDSDRKYNDPTLASITESQKSTVVTPYKKYDFLPSGNTTPLQKSPKMLSNKEDHTKNKNITQNIEEEIQQPKTHKNKDNTDDNGKPSKNSP